MWKNNLKTALLMSTLIGFFLAAGNALGGAVGMTIALLLAMLINGVTYFFSDKIILKLYNAQPLNQTQHAALYNTVHELAHAMNLPMPRLWIINTPVANAFATGRNPAHSAIAVTTGILELLDPHELRGVLAHELSHIANRDTLICTTAATMATAIGYIGNMLYYAPSHRGQNNTTRTIGNILFILLLPLMTLLIRLSISRSREYLADEKGAETCKDPLALASALNKLHTHTQQVSFSAESATTKTTAGLFIVKPFAGKSLLELLCTHPPVKKRIAALYKIHETLQ